MKNRIIWGILGALALMVGIASCTTVHPGEVGVVFNKLTGSLTTGQQGLVFKLPFFSK